MCIAVCGAETAGGSSAPSPPLQLKGAVTLTAGVVFICEVHSFPLSPKSIGMLIILWTMNDF